MVFSHLTLLLLYENANQLILPNGIFEEAFGNITINQRILLSSINSAESFWPNFINQRILLSSINSAESFWPNFIDQEIHVIDIESEELFSLINELVFNNSEESPILSESSYCSPLAKLYCLRNDKHERKLKWPHKILN